MGLLSQLFVVFSIWVTFTETLWSSANALSGNDRQIATQIAVRLIFMLLTSRGQRPGGCHYQRILRNTLHYSTLRGFYRQVLHLRHYLIHQQAQRAPPRRRVFHIVEAEDQQLAEAADVLVDRLQLLRHRRRRADQPVVLRAIVRGDVGIGHLRLVLQVLEKAEAGQQGQEVFRHHPAHHATDRQPPGLRVGLG